MLTTSVLLGALLAIGLFVRHYSARTRVLMLACIVVAIFLLSRGG